MTTALHRLPGYQGMCIFEGPRRFVPRDLHKSRNHSEP